MVASGGLAAGGSGRREDDVREVFEAVLPEKALADLIGASGMQKRQRMLDPLRLVRAAVISAARGGAGRQVAMLETYFESGAPKVVRGAAYGWFSPAFENAMKSVSGGSLTATLEGKNVILTDEKGGKSTVVATDLMGSNGVVHVINSVLMPK